MFMGIPEDYTWIYPWVTINHRRAISKYGNIVNQKSSNDVAQALVDELKEEIHSRHPLYGADFQAVAYCEADFNEVLYLVNRPTIPIVCVHLTWEEEHKPQWPHFDSYESLDAWTEQMKKELEQPPPGWTDD